MNLRTDQPYWLMKNGFFREYPAVTSDIETEVAVVGAGITGALVAYALGKEGVQVAVVDKRHPAFGSTAATTALLQYEIDESLPSLMRTVGRGHAVSAYLACGQAIDALASIVEAEKLDADFHLRPSLKFASRKKDVLDLREEYQARKDIGLDVVWMEADEVRERFHLPAPAGLWSRKGAEVDAYRLTHGLLNAGMNNLKVYDASKVIGIDCRKNRIKLSLANGSALRAKHLVLACGYETRSFLPEGMFELTSTYAMVSKPIDHEGLWKDNALLWETRTPYLYMRITDDNRIIVGGRDDKFYHPRQRNRAVTKKTDCLLEDMARLRPDLEIIPDFRWAGAFGQTRDSLPYAGRVPGMDNTYAVLGLGGNGIVFSQTGAEVVRDMILGRDHPLGEVYSFRR